MIAEAMPERQPSERVDERERPPAPAPLARLPAVAHAEAARRGQLGAAGVLGLQRAVGNAAVGRILSREPTGTLPEVINPFEDEPAPTQAELDQEAADFAKLGEKVGKRLIDTLTGRDWVLFTSRLRALDVWERLALKQDAEFWTQLRKHLSPLAYWSVQLRVRFGEHKPTEVIALSAAIHSRDWHRARTLLFAYRSLKDIVGLREVIVSQFPKAQADDLRAILVETQTRAESGLTHYKEAHYEDGKIDWFEGDENYELVRTARYLRVIVRIRLYEDPANKKTAITDKLVSEWEASIMKLWNGKFRARSGAKTLDVWFIPVFVYHDESAHHQVKVTYGNDRSSETHWYSEDDGVTAAHEFGHMLGNPDEYNLPGAIAEIPAAFRLSNAQQRRSSWEGVTGTKKPLDTKGYDVAGLMGAHHKSTAVQLRHAADVVDTFNAKLRLPGEAPWTVEAQK